ncbi:MAG TPA: heavy metal translocating P-type ATPase metal-binding domain-containing protein, partial [Oceanipulchritudo sp.]|nr:heavy metal translocating P-type ATPase metal-binding domain-containing protein [Oceanipulchritudo sp.]
MSKETYRKCIHCGTPFSIAARKESEFCCNGCEYVYRLIRQSGLEHYYDLRDKRINPVQPGALQPRDYAWLEKRAAACEAASPKLAEMILDLEGISCVGCVWLIEKVFRDHPGAVRLEINTQYGQVRMQWRPGVFRVVDFAREIQQFGYVFGPPGERPQEESRRLVGKIGLSGAFALNAMLFTLPRYLGMEPSFSLAPLFELLSLLFATLALLAGGSYFINRGVRGILQGVLHIDFPIAIGIVVAWAGSILGWLIKDERFLYFDFVAIFIFLMLVGRWVQERALERNRHQLLSRNKAPREVHVVEDNLQGESNQPLEALRQSQLFRVLPGEVVPVLAELESIRGAISLEWINGESAMRTLTKGQYVPSGAQNIGIEPILLKARQTWKESLLARLLEAHPEEQRNPFIEKVLKLYLVVVLAVATAGGLLWSLVAGEPLTALQVVLSVLVVSCPCALGVAYPLAQEWAILHLRRFGIFVRTPTLFGELGKVRQVVFDKTGTLTMEAPQLANEAVLKSLAPRDHAVLREMVKSSLHPVSRALRESLLKLEPPGISLPDDLHIREEIGMGLVAESAQEGLRWTLGRPGWQAAEVSSPTNAHGELRLNGELITGFVFEEAMRDDARESVDWLRKHFAVSILSGDRIEKVLRMARQLGLPESAASGERSPEEKARFM